MPSGSFRNLRKTESGTPTRGNRDAGDRRDSGGADSLALVELTLVFEETFDIEMPEEEADGIRTVRHAITAVEKVVPGFENARA
jgi:acyl carrier protein